MARKLQNRTTLLLLLLTASMITSNAQEKGTDNLPDGFKRIVFPHSEGFVPEGMGSSKHGVYVWGQVRDAKGTRLLYRLDGETATPVTLADGTKLAPAKFRNSADAVQLPLATGVVVLGRSVDDLPFNHPVYLVVGIEAKPITYAGKQLTADVQRPSEHSELRSYFECSREGLSGGGKWTTFYLDGTVAHACELGDSLPEFNRARAWLNSTVLSCTLNYTDSAGYFERNNFKKIKNAPRLGNRYVACMGDYVWYTPDPQGDPHKDDSLYFFTGKDLKKVGGKYKPVAPLGSDVLAISRSQGKLEFGRLQSGDVKKIKGLEAVKLKTDDAFVLAWGGPGVALVQIADEQVRWFAVTAEMAVEITLPAEVQKQRVVWVHPCANRLIACFADPGASSKADKTLIGISPQRAAVVAKWDGSPALEEAQMLLCGASEQGWYLIRPVASDGNSETAVLYKPLEQ
jgi:hypothetical protein